MLYTFLLTEFIAAVSAIQTGIYVLGGTKSTGLSTINVQIALARISYWGALSDS